MAIKQESSPQLKEHVIDQQISKVIRNAFILLGLMILSTVGIAISTVMYLDVLYTKEIFTGAIIGSVILSVLTVIFSETKHALSFAILTTIFQGVFLGLIVNNYADRNMDGLWVALFTTVILFTSLIIYSIRTKDKFNSVEGLFVSVIISLVALSGFNTVYLKSGFMDSAVGFGGVILFSSSVLWEMGKITSGQQKNYVRAAVLLYVDAINIFLSILRSFDSKK